MNKFSTVLLLFGVCLTQAAPVDEPYEEPDIPIIFQENDAFPDGQYKYSYVSADGSSQEQNAAVKVVENVPVLSVEGKYTYEDSDGIIRTVTYYADETGYHAEGDILPVGPPVPEAILKSLEYIAEHPYVEPEKKP